MTRADLTEKILDIKREKGWSWKHIHEKIGGTSPVLLVGALLGLLVRKALGARASEGGADLPDRQSSTEELEPPR